MAIDAVFDQRLVQIALGCKDRPFAQRAGAVVQARLHGCDTGIDEQGGAVDLFRHGKRRGLSIG